MRKIIIVLMCIGLLVSWQICQSEFAMADDGHKCSIAGVWKITNLDPENYSEVWTIITPLDPAGKKFATKGGDVDYYDGTFGNPNLPEDTDVKETFGYTERISPGFYQGIGYTYARSNAEKRNVWKFVDRSEIMMVDCDTAVARGIFEFFFWFGPETGWVSLDCIPYTAALERITLTPACGELPPWPDGDDHDNDN